MVASRYYVAKNRPVLTGRSDNTITPMQNHTRVAFTEVANLLQRQNSGQKWMGKRGKKRQCKFGSYCPNLIRRPQAFSHRSRFPNSPALFTTIDRATDAACSTVKVPSRIIPTSQFGSYIWL